MELKQIALDECVLEKAYLIFDKYHQEWYAGRLESRGGILFFIFGYENAIDAGHAAAIFELPDYYILRGD